MTCSSEKTSRDGNDDQNAIDGERLLPLEGGSNFRDLGGYTTGDGKAVRRGMIFRSGVMTGLTERDQALLAGLGIRTIIDLRSREEVELFPNHWAVNHGLNFVSHDYSMTEISSRMYQGQGREITVDILYQNFPNLLKPQLNLLFGHLLAGDAPLVFNCSAGQDRTGVASALILNILGVDWETIIEDYHLSTEYRRPDLETAGVDLHQHRETNDFARLILRNGSPGSHKPMPLLTEDNRPFLEFAFAAIEEDYGSVFSYVDREFGVDERGVARLRDFYLSD